MNKRFRELKLRQLSETLETWRNTALPQRPPSGWARAIREALGMSAATVGDRLGMSGTGVIKLEKAESNDTITLTSLRKLAEALNCELRYALVPRQPLTQYLHERAREVARARLQPVAHTMALEDQAGDAAALQLQIDVLAEEILRGPRRELW